MSKKLKFKINEKVRLIYSRNPGMNSWLAGKVGIVKQIDNGSKIMIGVEFNEKIVRGNDLNGRCKDGYGYYCHQEQIESMDLNLRQMKFHVSDRIMVARTLHLPVVFVPGTTGFVREVFNDSNEVGVEFDDIIPGCHDLGRKCEFGRGYYLCDSFLTKLEPISVIVARINNECSKEILKFGDKVKVIRNAPAIIIERKGIVKEVSGESALVTFEGEEVSGDWLVSTANLMKIPSLINEERYED
jgi:hypothetical protein